MKNELTAKRLSLALSNAGLKPQELAEKSNVSKSSISQYINGSHAPSNISSGKMAPILCVNPLWLMGFNVPMSADDSATVSDGEEVLVSIYRKSDEATQRRLLAYAEGLRDAIMRGDTK